MERLTSRNPHGRAIVKDFPAYEEYELVTRLAAIEDILGNDYDLDRLCELAQADREGRCVIFQPGPAVVSHYYQEDGLYILEAAGVVSKEEYENAAISTISEEEAAEITGYKCPICENHEMCVLPYMKPLCGETYTHFKPKTARGRTGGNEE